MALFYTITNDVPLESPTPEMVTGVIIVDPEDVPGPNQKSRLLNRTAIVNFEVISVTSEFDLFQELAKLVNFWNPDIVVGYEVSWLVSCNVCLTSIWRLISHWNSCRLKCCLGAIYCSVEPFSEYTFRINSLGYREHFQTAMGEFPKTSLKEVIW
jgi:hypothetical protein